jgi:hypothetical protein
MVEMTACAAESHGRVVALVVVANDEARLASVLQSVAWAPARVAVDLGSNDSSIRTCTAHGVSIVSPDALGPELTRQGADWILLIEGHEEAPPALADEIEGVVRASDASRRPVAYRIRRRIRFLGHTLQSRVWESPAHVRLARGDAISWPQNLAAMEGLRVRGPVGRLKVPLIAQPYANLRHYVSRVDVLSCAAAQLHYQAGRPVGWRDLAVQPLSLALRLLPRAAARDGMPGAMLGVLEAYRLAATSAKRWELEHVSEPRAGAR